MPKENWTRNDIPSQVGKLAIVTGATGGLGFETALALADAGATVILAGRNETKGKEAMEKLLGVVPTAKISFEKIDLGSLKSISEFCARFNSQHQVLDLLVNNAGVMAPPKREVTEDGFELQFGTNHLAHFALTAGLLPALRRSSSGPRVVNVASTASKFGKIKFDDLQSEHKYCAFTTYGQSKLANLLFTLELQRRSDEGGWGLLVTSAHPGYARTELMYNGPGYTRESLSTKFGLWILPNHSAAEGALPSLYAATSPDATPGGYYGPQGMTELKGPPGPAKLHADAKDAEVAKKLWDVSTTLTNVSWP
jgi:NAD(P)-dependent dehydrogenase (short-subunit alcohol dehydrogenase family)